MSDNRSIAKLEALEPLIGRFLQVGVLVSAFITAAGLLASWLLQGSRGFTLDDVQTLRNGKLISDVVVPRTFSAIRDGLVNVDPGTFVSIGLMALIALPILRVALTFILFVHQKDFLYTILTLVVLTTLIVGVVLGKGL